MEKLNRVAKLEELVALRKEWRAWGLRVVLTNGAFDLLHRGHVRYLQQARDLGNILIVGINSDASVRGNKGEGRPIVPQDERAEVVASLRCVEYAVIFDEPTATQLVESLHPDIYVKGGDYAPGGKPLPEASAVEAGGGEVKILPFDQGHSTSDLIGRVMRET